MAHENCSLKIVPGTVDAFYIDGAKAGFQDDGDWDEDTRTMFYASIDDLFNIHYSIASAAVTAGLGDCKFTTSRGHLIAVRNEWVISVLDDKKWNCSR